MNVSGVGRGWVAFGGEGGLGVDMSETCLSPRAKLRRARRGHAGGKRGLRGDRGQRRLTGCPVSPSTQKTNHDDTVNAKAQKKERKSERKERKEEKGEAWREGGIVCEAEVLSLVGGLGLGLGQRTTALGDTHLSWTILFWALVPSFLGIRRLGQGRSLHIVSTGRKITGIVRSIITYLGYYRLL